jgi:hypothetical protein
MADLSRRLGGRLAPEPVATAGPGSPGSADGWIGVDDLLADDGRFPALARAAGPRFRSDDWALVGAQLVREWVSAVTVAAVTAWGRERRLLDWTAANVAVRADGRGTVGLRRLDLVVLADDDLAGTPGVTVSSADRMVDALLDGAVGHPVRAGARPPGPPGAVAAVAAIVAAARRAVRSGDRHYWGTAGLAAANALTAISHEVGPRADRDRALVLGRRPDLARTVEVVTVDDGLGHGETVSCTRRRTCCLLVKLPGEVQCGTCNLRDRDECLATLTARARADRARQRAALAG